MNNKKTVGIVMLCLLLLAAAIAVPVAINKIRAEKPNETEGPAKTEEPPVNPAEPGTQETAEPNAEQTDEPDSRPDEPPKPDPGTKAGRLALARIEAERVAREIFKPGMTQTAQVYAIHDYVHTIHEQNDHRAADSDPPEGWCSAEAYGALLQHRADSAGCSYAVALLCDEAGLESRHINEGLDRHQWSIVAIKDGSYKEDRLLDETAIVEVTADGKGCAWVKVDAQAEDAPGGLPLDESVENVDGEESWNFG